MSEGDYRQQARDLFDKVLLSADPFDKVAQFIHSTATEIKIGTCHGHWQRIQIVAIGKAACRMTEAAQRQLAKHHQLLPPLVVTNAGNWRAIPNANVIVSGHPLPDLQGIQASKTLIELVGHLNTGDLLLLLLSGGGSALLPSPAANISLDDKIALNRLLLNCGATIQEINCIRKHCSTLKGGGLLRCIGSADVCTLAISDVFDDDPASIASGPTVTDPTFFSDAIELLKQYQIWNACPASIQQHLLSGQQGQQVETLKSYQSLSGRVSFDIIASNQISVDYLMSQLSAANFLYCQQLNRVTGEAQVVALELVRRVITHQSYYPYDAFALAAGGETTVTLTAQAGKGGRNQELALAFAIQAEKLGLTGQWCLLSAGTDGQDGPTDAAGAIVDQDSLVRIRNAGISPEQALLQHDSYNALHASNDLLITGATGTNVADVQCLLWKPH